MTKTICFDLRCMQIGHESRGIGMHVRSMLENLDPSKDYRYIFYTYDMNNPIEDLSIKVPANYTLVQTKTLKKSIDRPQDFLQLARVIYHRYSPLRGREIDLFIQFDFMLGLPRMASIKKTLLVAYDLIPLIFRDEYIPTPTYAFTHTTGLLKKLKKTLRSLYYQRRYNIHYKNFIMADSILSISKNTAESVSDLLGVASSRIFTIPLAPVMGSDLPQRPKLLPAMNRPFIFYIGATDARKKITDLIEAFSLVRDAGHEILLVLAGKEFSDPAKIPNNDILLSLANTKYRSDILTIGFVSDAEKMWLYSNSTAFVFPTLYEGFGLPVLEAMRAGCPVIAYDNSSIPEVSGRAAILVESGNVHGLTANIEKVIVDKEFREQQIKLGLKQAERYTWTSYMKQFYKLIGTLSDDIQ